MLIKRKNLLELYEVHQNLKNKNINLSLNLKYKVLKFLSIIKEEIKITQTLIREISLKYAEIKDNKFITTPDGGIKIQDDKIPLLSSELDDFYYSKIQIPDFYYSLDEIEEFNLDWDELEIFLSLIKE